MKLLTLIDDNEIIKVEKIDMFFYEWLQSQMEQLMQSCTIDTSKMEYQYINEISIRSVNHA